MQSGSLGLSVLGHQGSQGRVQITGSTAWWSLDSLERGIHGDAQGLIAASPSFALSLPVDGRSKSTAGSFFPLQLRLFEDGQPHAESLASTSPEAGSGEAEVKELWLLSQVCVHQEADAKHEVSAIAYRLLLAYRDAEAFEAFEVSAIKALHLAEAPHRPVHFCPWSSVALAGQSASKSIAVGIELLASLEPQSVLHMAWAPPPCADLRLRTSQAIAAVEVSGRKGCNECINGVYKLTGAVFGGRPAYQSSSGLWLLHSEDFSPHRWTISASCSRLTENFAAFCPSSSFARCWRVTENFGFDTDPRVSVKLRSSGVFESERSLSNTPPAEDKFQKEPRVAEAQPVPVFIIAVHDRQQQVQSIASTLETARQHCDFDLSVQVLPAVDTRGLDPASLPQALRQRLLRRRLGAAPFSWYLSQGIGRGSLGCALSHAAAYRALLEAPGAPDFAVVLEDDAVVLPERWAHLGRLVEASKDADLLLLGFSASDSHDIRCRILNEAMLLGDSVSSDFLPAAFPVAYFYRTFAYVITRRGAQRVLDSLFPLAWQLDTELAQLCALGQLKALGCLPFLVMHPGHDSADFLDYEVFCRMPAGGCYESTAQASFGSQKAHSECAFSGVCREEELAPALVDADVTGITENVADLMKWLLGELPAEPRHAPRPWQTWIASNVAAAPENLPLTQS
ncbi:unnamed protein product [Polarella glacialis]|uniref:Glycosyl transferase family 25 domain-containing protein n=1 Tax=Polarella glacialis TaxID=89957 RepID=A0A813D811_POLGL|nr:unnamed protein product [Polarella glacialis]